MTLLLDNNELTIVNLNHNGRSISIAVLQVEEIQVFKTLSTPNTTGLREL